MVSVTSPAGVPPKAAIMNRVKRPSSAPASIAPMKERAKSPTAAARWMCCELVTAASRMAKIEIAAASLSNASPSTRRVRRVAAPMSRKMPTTALGSVVATMAPTSRQTCSGICANGNKASPMVAVLTTTATTASSSTVAISCDKRRTSMARAPWNTRIGRKISRKDSLLSGKSSRVRAAPSKALVKLVRSSRSAEPPIRMPTRASITVSGRCRRWASGCTALTTTSSTAMASRIAARLVTAIESPSNFLFSRNLVSWSAPRPTVNG